MALRIASWFLILFACFYGIDSYPLMDNNEGLYGAVAKEMLADNQFVIPKLLGVPYIEKPPMLYWLLSASMSLFGQDDGPVHLVPALAYFITAFGLQRFTRRVTGSEATGLAAALMLVTPMSLLFFARKVLCDMIMTCFFSFAMWDFYLWQQDQKRKHLLAFYACLALAVLSKGLTAIILAGGIIGLFYLWERKPLSFMLRTLSPAGIGLFLCIAAPWHILASLAEPGFAWFYFINEHLLRFTNQRLPHDYHVGKWWYYLPHILRGLAPWTLFLLVIARKPRPSTSLYPQLVRFLWSWFLFCLIFFSAAGSKGNYYMLVGMPPLALLTILYLKPYMDKDNRVARSITTGCLCLALLLLYDLYGNVAPEYILYGVAAVALCWYLPLAWLPPLLGSYIVLALPMLIDDANSADDKLSQKNVAAYLQSLPGKEVAMFQEFDKFSAIGFYLQKPLLIVDNHSPDLAYAKRREEFHPSSHSIFLTLDDWAKRKPLAPLVVPNIRLQQAMASLRTLGADRPRVCVAKRFERVTILSMCEYGHPD